MVLCSVVAMVVFPGIPIDSELSLFHPVTEPIESHVDCFGSFLFNGIVDDTSRGTVVRFEWSGRLFVSQFL